MTYRISPLDKEQFLQLFKMNDKELARRCTARVIATADAGYPCRISLQDAKEGDSLILLNYVSHDVATPYRSAYAIYVRENAEQAEPLIDCIPAVFGGRAIALRGFDKNGMLRDARLALPGEADCNIRGLFGNTNIAYIHAHNAAHGCFSARIDRTGETA